MQRISNRQHPDQVYAAPQVHYVDREIEIPVLSEPQMIQTQVETRVEVPVDRIVEKIIHIESPPVDLKPLEERIHKMEVGHKIMAAFAEKVSNFNNGVMGELEMQRRALVAIKAQRDVDRKRRLQLIMKLKKQRDEQKVLNLRYKLAVGASLLLSILSLIIK